MENSAVFDEEQISSLSETQDKILALLPIIPSLLSAWGSANIVYMFFRSKKSSAYRRIMLGLSCGDCINSLLLIFQHFLLPHETSQKVWAIGTDASCSAMGFVAQFNFTSVWYNGMLSVYFLLLVKFGVKDPVFKRKYEPWMHVASIGYPLATAIAGAKIGLYHELKLGDGCWITDYPEGCECIEDPDGVCCQSSIYGWFFGGIPTVISFLMILTNNVIVYCHVQRTISGKVSTTNSAASLSADPHIQRIRAVRTQCSFYVLAFLVTYVPALTIRVMESMKYDPEDEADIFPLLVIQAVTLPSQGIFNVLIFVRPTYLRARQEFPDESRYWAFRRALHGEKVQPTDDQGPSALFSAPASHVVLSAKARTLSQLAVSNEGHPSMAHHEGMGLSLSSRLAILYGRKQPSETDDQAPSLEFETGNLSTARHERITREAASPPVVPMRLDTEGDDAGEEESFEPTPTTRSPLKGFLLSLKPKKKNQQRKDSQYVSSLVGSEFDFIDVAPQAPARVQSEAEGLPRIPTRQESIVATIVEDEAFNDDSPPSIPQRSSSQVEDQTEEPRFRSGRTDEAPSKPLRPESEMEATQDDYET